MTSPVADADDAPPTPRRRAAAARSSAAAQHPDRLELHPAELPRLRRAHPRAGDHRSSTWRSRTGTSSARPTGSGLANFRGCSATRSFHIALLEHALLRGAAHPADARGLARSGAAAQQQAARRRVLPHRGLLPLHHLDRRDRGGVEPAVQPRLRADQPGAARRSASPTRPDGSRRRTGRCPPS